MSRKLLYIFLCSFFVHVLFASVAFSQSNGTFINAFYGFDGYYEISKNLLAGHGFSKVETPPFVPSDERTPLYPLGMAILVSVFKNYYAVILAQIILSSVIIPFLAYRITMQILARERIATMVALILAFEPLAVHLATKVVSETLFTALFLASVTLLFDYLKEARGKTLVYAGGMLALATLVRPTVQYLPLLFILAVFWTSRKQIGRAARHSLVFCAVFLLVLSPWVIRNFLVFHRAALNVQQTSVLYAYFIPSVIAIEQHTEFSKTQHQFFRGDGNITDPDDITLENASYYNKRAIKLLASHPIGIFKSIGMTMFTFFTHDGYWDILRRFNYVEDFRIDRPLFMLFLESPREAIAVVRPLLASPALFVMLGRLVWMLIAASFIGGAILYLRTSKERAKGIVALLVVFYFAATTIIVGLGVNARYRVPVNALILTFAVYGAYGLLSSINYRAAMTAVCPSACWQCGSSTQHHFYRMVILSGKCIWRA